MAEVAGRRNMQFRSRDTVLAKFMGEQMIKPAHFLRAIAVFGAIGAAALPAQAEPAHGIAMHGAPKYDAGFTHLDYANPDAPKGGTLRLAAIGTYDSFNRFVIKGRSAAGSHMLYETLLQRVWDEPFTLYGLIAESIETPEDRSWVTFTLREEARFTDGSPIAVDDVIFSWETIRTQGRPNSRTTYNKVARAEQTGPRSVKFTFNDDVTDRELPLLIGGFLPILSKAYWEGRDFTETTLEPPVSSGPYVIDKFEAGRGITYRRDPNYWGANIPVNVGHNNFDVIKYTYFKDNGVALEAFKAGDYDYRIEFSASRWAQQYDFPARERGDVTMEIVPHGIPSGLRRALVFNTRHQIFDDPQVRKALSLVFDFEWINANLLNSGYVRTASLFDNSEMKPVGPPSAAEMALLEPWRDQLPAEVFGEPYAPPVTDGSGNDRRPLREASKLLDEAGWTVKNGVRVNGRGQPFVFEILLSSSSNEKLALAYQRNLKRLGVDARVRLADSAQYAGRLEDFDFDMILVRWGVTLSPGNEQYKYWSSEAAAAPGSRNYAGISNPALDAMIDTLVAAKTRQELVTAARALDRILMWGNYVLPLYHDPGFRIARWNKVARPAQVPTYGAVLETFWAEE